MKYVLTFALAAGLAGCSALAPTVPTPAVTQTPYIIIQTVVVTVIPTMAPTDTPTSTPTATLTPIPTFTAQGTSSSSTAAATLGTGTAETPVPSGSLTATLPADAGGTLFTNLTRSSDHLALRCQPDTVTFGVTSTDPALAEVDLFYRVEDKNSSSISGWVDIGKMTPDGTGNFTFDFKGSMVYSDLRTKEAWLDYQFVGINKVGQVVGRSAKIVKQITYTLDCPG